MKRKLNSEEVKQRVQSYIIKIVDLPEGGHRAITKDGVFSVDATSATKAFNDLQNKLGEYWSQPRDTNEQLEF